MAAVVGVVDETGGSEPSGARGLEGSLLEVETGAGPGEHAARPTPPRANKKERRFMSPLFPTNVFVGEDATAARSLQSFVGGAFSVTRTVTAKRVPLLRSPHVAPCPS